MMIARHTSSSLIMLHILAHISLPKVPEMRFNWFTSIFGLAFLWGLAGYCMANPAAANAKLGSWLSVVTKVNRIFADLQRTR